MKIKSKQQSIQFLFTPSPIEIDKRQEWGDNPENIQKAPNGAFLKLNDDGISISHLVQPNTDKTAPIGWVPTDKPGHFDKEPIHVSLNKRYDKGDIVKIETLDGTLKYKVKEPSYLCSNFKLSGQINKKDSWIQTVRNLENSYYFTDPQNSIN